MSDIPAVFDDEVVALPSPAAGAEAAAVDGGFDASLLEGVGLVGEVIPVGTYAFRLDRFYENFNEPNDEKYKELGAQPGFGLLWICQQEPHTGKTFMDNCPFVNSKTREAAKAGEQVALELVRNRLPRAKSIMQAAGYKPSGKFDFKDFLSSHPEIKIQLKIQEKKMKDPGNPGKYKGTGSMTNAAEKYLPLQRPA